MNQRTIDRLVARATGEGMSDIRRIGFTIANPVRVRFDPEGQTVDWDELEQRQRRAVSLQRPRKQRA